MSERLRSRSAGFDAVGALISAVDLIERMVRALWRSFRAVLRHRGLGLTGGLAWRGLAAVTGIGMAAALVTGLSADGGEARLASLAEQQPQQPHQIRDIRQAPRPLAAGPESWVRIARPVALFGLEAPELERQALSYEARRSHDGARREDILSFGGFAESKPHLQLRLGVDHGDDQLIQPLVIALVREAALLGMSVERSGAPAGIATKFGSIETTDAVLSDGAAQRPCIGFRHRGGDRPLRLSGWWCGTAERPAERRTLACLIDRIELLSAGDDQALRTAFARTELNRDSSCARMRVSAVGSEAAPRMKATPVERAKPQSRQ